MVEARVATRHHQNDTRQGKFRMAEEEGLDMPHEVMHGNERPLKRHRQRLGKGDPDEQGPYQSWALGHGNRIGA
jgi:hypothetical protein